MQKKMEKVLALEKVQAALSYIKENHLASMEEHKQFIACEAPTFHEEKRAALYCEKLKELGIEDAKIDAYGNVYGYRKGAGKGPTVLVEAHMDTVFPFGSVKEIRDEDGIIYAPGATDDTRGMTAILAALRAMNAAGIQNKGDIIFAGTTREEGSGSLGGMRDFLAYGPKVDASLSIDGASTEAVTCEATGYYTYEVNFHGIGGHAYAAFGEVANPLHAAARAVAKIADFDVPDDPKTTFCVSNFHAGNVAGAHAIVKSAQIIFNIRSNDQTILEDLRDRCFKAIQEACDEESAKWQKDVITWDYEEYCNVPAGVQDHNIPIVQAAYVCAKHFSPDPEEVDIRKGGSVNGNRAIAAGVPCVTIGGGKLNCKIHTLEEYFPYKEAYRLPQEILTMLCLLSGVEGESDSVLL